ncbi:MAG TPA: 16S rRNA (cytosine(967)-C(5))-methyltransferase RsmB [Candidatus Binatia bacterium]|jgi:16S rRNA (cytosine967-C5)-methyltransferase
MGPELKKARASEPTGVKSCRALAVEALLKIETRKAYADILLDHTLKSHSLSAQNRALLTQLVYGALRWRGKLDWLLGKIVHRPLADMDGYLRNILRLTVYQILFLDKVPSYAAVHEGVELAKRYGGASAGGLVNAVARRLLREKERLTTLDSDADLVARLSVSWSHPEWLVRKWLAYFGAAETEALLRANNEESPVILRANRLKIDRQSLIERLQAAGFDVTPAPRSPQSTHLRNASSIDQVPGFKEGLFLVQGEASQLVGLLLDPKPGERILDACAAPGGKTTHLAELMEDRGEVVATDISVRGIEKLRQNIRRLDLKSVRPVQADVSLELTGELALPYDRILADLPCSGLGTLRSHPEAKWHREEKDIERLSRLQKKILARLSCYLKPGGFLVYSTCTLIREENEAVVEGFLQRHREFTLENAAEFLPESARHMVRGNYFLALPHRDGTDGFFAARMRKRA